MPKKSIGFRLDQILLDALQSDAEEQTKQKGTKITRSDRAREIIEDYYSLSDRPNSSNYPPKLMCPKYVGGKWMLLETLLTTCKDCGYKKNACPAWTIFGHTSVPQTKRS